MGQVPGDRKKRRRLVFRLSLHAKQRVPQHQGLVADFDELVKALNHVGGAQLPDGECAFSCHVLLLENDLNCSREPVIGRPISTRGGDSPRITTHFGEECELTSHPALRREAAHWSSNDSNPCGPGHGHDGLGLLSSEFRPNGDTYDGVLVSGATSGL